MIFFQKKTWSKHWDFGAAATHEKTEADYNAHLQVAQHKIEIGDVEVIENKIAFQQWQKFVRANFLPRKTLKEQLKRFVPEVLIRLFR